MLDSFQNYFSTPVHSSQDTAFVPAITSAFNICKHIGGRMLLFQVSNAIQKMPELQPKQGAEQNVGDKFGQSNLFFQNTASELAHAQVSVDLFVFTTGKGVYKNLQTTRSCAWEAVFRVRTSTGFN